MNFVPITNVTQTPDSYVDNGGQFTYAYLLMYSYAYLLMYAGTEHCIKYRVKC